MGRNTTGFTLVEVMVAATISIFVLTGVITAALFIGRSAANIRNYTDMETQGRKMRLVVFGDSDFASDEYVQLARMFQVYQAGAEMLFNAIGWTVEDEALTPLRAKTMQARPIKLSSDKSGWVLMAANLLGVPLLFIGFGVVLWRVRRSRRLGLKL